MDLSGIKVPGAILDNVLADSTNLSNSNLAGATIQMGWLREANFTGAKLHSVQFGQFPTINLGETYPNLVYNGMLFSSKGTTVTIWDLDTKKQINTIDCKVGMEVLISCMAVVKKTLFAGYSSGFYSWDITTGQQQHGLWTPEQPLVFIVANATSVFASCGADIVRWDIATAQLTARYNPQTNSHVISVSEEHFFCAIEADIEVWDLFLSQRKAVLKLQKPPFRLLVQEEKLLAICSSEVCVWDASTLQQFGKPIKYEEILSCPMVACGHGFLTVAMNNAIQVALFFGILFFTYVSLFSFCYRCGISCLVSQ